MKEFPFRNITIDDPFWTPRLQTNALLAIYHQWNELEKSGCIDNFRILTGEKEGFREGWVFADSDAYKWLDAAARIYANKPDEKLKQLMDGLIALLVRAQTADGYLYTYNQFHFPSQRWVNLQIEHEFYCFGHLIEACISHAEATGEDNALTIGLKAADLLVKDFLNGPPAGTDGHEEIEIALLKLNQLTGKTEYLELARHFIEVRGRIPLFPILYQQELSSHQQRKALVNQERARYALTHPEYAVTRIPADNESKLPPFSIQRRRLNALSGKYTQQHAPVRLQTTPVGHAVRYGYFQTATALLSRLSGDTTLLPALMQSWERLVTRRMYVTGGLGALPGNEGFGNDYELDSEYAYNETCAALASLFWNWEMTLTTREARHADLFEWQLYNAAAPGMGSGGDTYLYNNPLAVRGGITRRSWYSVPCCPSNLSRTWAAIGKYIYSQDERNLWVHQYIGSQPTSDSSVGVSMHSCLPYEGSVSLQLGAGAAGNYYLNLRLPSWCPPGGASLLVNDEPYPILDTVYPPAPVEATAQGYDPRLSTYLPVPRNWSEGDEIKLTFDLPVVLRRAHAKVKGLAGKAAVTRGPLVYCLESTDNPGVDIFTTVLEPDSLEPHKSENVLGAITVLNGKSTHGENLTFIPYHLWGNRGASQMNVWLKTASI